MKNSDFDRHSILVVDDERVNRRILVANLAKQGYSVMEAPSGREALLLAKSHPDIILLDVMMPEMDGIETCRHLKRDTATRDIPVIFLSAINDPKIKTQGLEAGGVDYLGKPFDPTELYARVKTHLTIRDQQRELHRYAEHLEDRVNERTQRLSAAEREIQRDYDIQYAINDILRLSLAETSLNALLQAILERVMAVPWLSIESRGAILLADDAQTSLRPVAFLNMPERSLEKCGDVPFGSCVCGKAALESKEIFANYDDPLHKRSTENAEPHSHFCIPIPSATGSLGVLNIYLSHGHRPDRKETEFLRTVANTLSGIIRYRRAQEALLHGALHDSLTGLPNRSMFLDRINAAVKTVQDSPDARFAVLLLDLDNFNMVNESYGHDTGDSLIREVGQRLKPLLSRHDILARLGGDEFAILSTDFKSPDHPTELAARAHEAMRAPFSAGHREIFMSTSIGIALSDLGYERAEDVLRDADTALHRAKLRGRARFEIFDKEMHDKARRLMQTVTDMRLAVEREEFVLHYQPVICLKTGRPAGVEALVRWNHPDRGLVPPFEFIPVAEETGMILPIGEWVMNEACRCMRGFFENAPACEQGQAPMLSVNLSGRQLKEADVLGMTRNALTSTGFPAAQLKLELTESVVMEDADFAIESLTQLKELHIKLAIDDFGTGYSSLAYLHKFPVDMLKIDRSFVSRMDGTGEHMEIVRSIVALAHSLGLKIIAEGVETREQMTLLKALGCEFAQGYYFAKPLPEADLRAMDLFNRKW